MAAASECEQPAALPPAPPQQLQQQERADDDKDNNDDNDDDCLLLSIVFLDMDGVLLPFQQQQISNSCIKALSYILQQVPSARLVLSSTWRVQEKYIQIILDALHQYYKDNEIGCEALMGIDFYDITNTNMHSERQHEIYEWLQRRHQQRLQRPKREHDGGKNDMEDDDDDGSNVDFYRPTSDATQKKTKNVRVAAWLALDDEELLEGDVNARHAQFFQGHVVKTDSHVGLTMDDAKNAVELLSCQLQKI
jgi:HAD domain in Swiss Army Knife RNA repair proteins